MFDPGLKQGQVLNNEEISEVFHCGNQGGMRKSKETNTLVLISDPTRGIYEDRWEGSILHYTGMGQTGDQDINWLQNRTLKESGDNGIEVFLFEVFKAKEYVYQGRVVLSKKPYQEKQADVNGDLRNVWIFPLSLTGEAPVPIPEELYEQIETEKEKSAKGTSEGDLLSLALSAPRTAGVREVVTHQAQRNPYVAELARRRAGGVCQLCKQEAPFHDRSGTPFLETHHVEWISRGGEDTIENVVALCPNCHRKMHILDEEADRSRLIKEPT